MDRHEGIKRVIYPGLERHAGHELAKKQMNGGFGSVVSFEVNFYRRPEISRFVEDVQRDDLIIYGESLASPDTILAYPALMSHGSMPREQRINLGISDGFFRLSLGFENSLDIINNLDYALSKTIK